MSRIKKLLVSLFSGSKNMDEIEKMPGTDELISLLEEQTSMNVNVSREQEDTPRAHHYLFAHRDLPELVFEDPEAFVALMRSPIAIQWLNRIWINSGDKVIAAKQGSRFAPDGLLVALHEFEQEICPIIIFPTAKATVEAFFAAVVKSTSFGKDEWRYFVLERIEGSEVTGVLCEWLSDGSRRNHEQNIVAEEDAFRKAIIQQLRRERLRKAAGVSLIAGISWDPSKKEKPVDTTTRPGAFRVQHCFFAFNAVPIAASKHLLKWIQAIAEGRAQSILDQLWSQAGLLAQMCEHHGGLPSDGLFSEVVQIHDLEYILITMPEPISAPEPYFLLVPIIEGRNLQVAEGSGLRIFTLELTDGATRPLICTIDIDRSHAIIGVASNIDRNSFVKDLSEFVLMGKPLPDSPPNTLRHLCLYAEIANLNRITDGDSNAKETKYPSGFGSIC